jgi:hypothetical protein
MLAVKPQPSPEMKPRKQSRRKQISQMTPAPSGRDSEKSDPLHSISEKCPKWAEQVLFQRRKQPNLSKSNAE